MRLIVVSGLSGSGKSVALNTLEDEGFYCIDNLPTGLIGPLVEQLLTGNMSIHERVAVGIDARSDVDDLRAFPQLLDELREREGLTVEVVFLQTATDTLLRRFSETRRKHPLSRDGMPLVEAIAGEQDILSGISDRADLLIDTTHLTLHGLRALLRERLLPDDPHGLSLLLQSFGFKNGVPLDSDFVFDVRCLPNPHWEPRLRALTGVDREVIAYLEASEDVERMYESIRDFLERWLPAFQAENRAYMTVSIGCTGGQHRSVYLAHRLASHFRDRIEQVSIRHRELQLSDRVSRQ
ncbi:MAG: RNase adapter RapZ [Halofilum sp. (in: g-proteobacteria)]